MSYDYYAESSYQSIDIEEIKETIKQLWIKIRQDRGIKWKKKAKEFLNTLGREYQSKSYQNLNKIRDQYQIFPNSYIKLFNIFEIIYKTKEIEDLIYQELGKDLHNNENIRAALDEFTLRPFLLDSYKNYFKKNNRGLENLKRIKRSLKVLKLDPKYIERKDIKKLCNDHLANIIFFININFTLKTPCLSKDDEIFYFIENPICRDTVFKIPYIRPNSWKGKLRWVASYNFLEKLKSSNNINWEAERCKLVRLFGNEKDVISSWLDDQIAKGLGKKSEEISKQFHSFLKEQHYISKEDNRRGRLIFYPTFLDKYGLDVITPNKRDTRTVSKETGPITLETAPKGSKGSFALLYFPYDYLWRKNIHSEAMEDLDILKNSIPDMLTKYGFGAKTTAGYGIIRNRITFQLFPFSNEIFQDDNFGKSAASKFNKKIDNLKEGGIN